ncbi:MAG: peptidylprolyl isomerase [Ignavibacteriaceae bacterium]|nr:peptidylprolyl isomerase [Ignavibacteriaceae bacterium]
MIDTNSTSNFYKNEIIRNWINKEVMYQEALKKGILKESEFNRLIENSKRELAASMLLQKYYEDEKVTCEPEELEDFYNRHKDEFISAYDSYLINRVTFNDEDKAVRFRTMVQESNWGKAMNAFKNDHSIIMSGSNELLYDYEIHPAQLLRIVLGLNPGEVSIVINTEPEKSFSIVQEVQKFVKDSVPPFQLLKPFVEKRLIAQKKEDLMKSYIRELYSKDEIEIRN